MTGDALLLAVGMSVAAGLVGCFAVMRRMALADDALSHVALPGIGVALALAKPRHLADDQIGSAVTDGLLRLDRCYNPCTPCRACA